APRSRCMTRRRRRGTDGEQDEARADHFGGPAEGYRGYGETGPQDPGPYQEDTGPWDTGSWDSGSGAWPGAGPPEPDWQAHPSGPLPGSDQAGQHPSGPLPPLPSSDITWQGGRPAADQDWDSQFGPREGYPGDGYSGGYPVGDLRTGGGTADGAGQDGPGDYGGGFRGGDPGSGGYPADYASGGYPADYGSGGYEGDGYSGGYQAAGFEQGYYDERGYDDGTGRGAAAAAGRGRREKPSSLDTAGYGAGVPGDRPGYPGADDWYPGDEDSQGWAADRLDEDFMAGPPARGLTSRDRAGSRPRGRGGRPGRKPKRGMRRVAPWLALIVVLAVVGAVGGVGYHFYRTYISPADYSGSGSGSVTVRILPGDSATAIGDRLQQAGVVASIRAFSNAAKASAKGSSLEPGYYRLHQHMKASLALALLLKPSSRVQLKIVIPEGWRLSQIVGRFGTRTGDTAGYQRAAKNAAALNLPGYAHGNPEGYLFPATYTLPPGTPPLQVLQAMVKRFRQEISSVRLPATAAHDQLSQADVITVASLVQAEGRNVKDFPKIARVIYNRLNAGMKLQLDSTVMYALHTYGIMASSQQLKVNSPYNTYQHTGLPPGPIDSPGDAAIRAALHPAPPTDNWLYFVTVNPKTGQTEFTSDPAVFQQLRAELAKNVSHK
ncbi:MAG: endolytic transglycosylase MltG, partial [Actinobacteria bacterium]|nr:endolytic transglycosylase MltG [Actinomycetota bacterium]